MKKKSGKWLTLKSIGVKVSGNGMFADFSIASGTLGSEFEYDFNTI